MRRALEPPLPEPAWAGTAEVLPFERERDAERVWDLITRGFAGEFGSHPRPFEEWQHLALRPGTSVICVFETGRLIAVSVNLPRGGEGFVSQLAVDPAERGRGLGLALLHQTFRMDHAAGLPATALTVDGENANARRLYEKAGMAVAEEFLRWDLDLTEGAAPAAPRGPSWSAQPDRQEPAG
jgi:ribosomal protein S18 acetylase RimI-like enzyme